MPRDDVAAVRAAREDPSRVVLEGFHAVKHALRFDATVERLLTPDRPELLSLADELAADLTDVLARRAVTVDAPTWRSLGAEGLPTPALAVALRPEDPATAGDGAAVLLEDPRHLGNLGACVRVAAAAGARAVYTTGQADPWHPSAVRAAAGLHFAVHVERLSGGLPSEPLVAVDPTGEPIGTVELPRDAIFAFGTERHGLTPQVRDRADLEVSIPMRPGVSSLNLATAVAVVLYTHRGVDGATGTDVRS
ncbi:MAG: TrmH family RNA methyltransferase [Nitriliruptorales bacterium]|nr:TrmH family RNA methyltransferase [Nitriliruptorales bacterium]